MVHPSIQGRAECIAAFARRQGPGGLLAFNPSVITLHAMMKHRRPMIPVVLTLAFLLAAAQAFAGNVWTESRRKPGDAPIQGAENLPDFVDLVKKVGPAIVNIETAQRGNLMSKRMRPDDPYREFFRRFFDDPNFDRKGMGTGFAVHEDGYIVTNNHVVENTDEITVRFDKDSRGYPARVIGTDEKTDIALLKIEPDKKLPVVVFGDSDAMQIGQWVIAIGNPFGLSHTVTKGIVSQKGRRDIVPSGRNGYYNFIQTDASINPGNSGGPLLNVYGEVIGINTAINAAGQGIGFAIPINMVKEVLPQLREKGKVVRSWLGVKIQQVTGDLADSFGMAKPSGALVAEVVPDGPSARAGLKNGDVIIEFDGKKIEESSDLPWFASTAGVGRQVTLKIIRGGKEQQIRVTLGAMNDDGESGTTQPQPGSAAPAEEYLGLRVKELTPAIRKSLRLDIDGGGVVVDHVQKGGAAFRAGVRPGDVIITVNDVRTGAPDQFAAQVKKAPPGGVIRLFLKRQEGSLFVAFRKE
ncbi:MAG: hypothetical protein GMKNLPBB_01552 [Myxococcota bacterium]|nr:hypothetical protein [Myxococcota bacterium]